MVISLIWKTMHGVMLCGIIIFMFMVINVGSTLNDSTPVNNMTYTTPSNRCVLVTEYTIHVDNISLYDMVTSLECLLQPYCTTSIINIIISYQNVHNIKVIEVKDDIKSIVITFQDARNTIEIPLYSSQCTELYSEYHEQVINEDIANGNVIFSLLDFSGWREIAFLHDMQSVSIVTTVAERLAKQDVYVTLFNIDLFDKDDLKSTLTSLNTDLMDGALNISLICDNNSALEILLTAHDFHNKYVHGKMRIQHISKWIIFSYSDITQDSLNLINLDNIVFVNLKGGFYISNDIILCDENMTEWFSVSTLMWRAEVRREFSRIGNISMHGDVMITSKLYPNTDYGFNGRMLKATTIPFGGMTIITDNGNYTGLCFDVLNEIARRLNFTYEIIIPEDGAFGAELKNGSWTGMVGLIQREQVDLVASSLTINPQRERVLDFTYPIVFDHMTVVYAKPRVHKWRTLIDPFQTIVIGLIGVVLVVVSLLFYGIERFNPKKREENSLPHNFANTFWYFYGALLAQGGVTLPTSLAGRTIVSCWWIFCIVSIAVYSGNLTAAFTVNKQRLPFTNLEEMVKQTEYKWGVLGNSVYETVFKESDVSTYKEVWNGIVKFNQTDPGVLSSSGLAHLRKVTQGNYALIMEKQYIDYELADNCNLIILDEKIAQNQVAFAMGNNSPFIRIVSDEILSLHEVGLLEKWKEERWPQKSCDSQEFKTRMISVEDIQSAFYLIAIGVVLSLSILVSEKVVWKFKLSCRARSTT